MGSLNLAALEQTFNEIECCHRSLCDRTRATSISDRPALNQPPQQRYPKIRTTLILQKQQAMTQALPKPIAFEEFLEWKPETGRFPNSKSNKIKAEEVEFFVFPASFA
jgi:hypothetical protein